LGRFFDKKTAETIKQEFSAKNLEQRKPGQLAYLCLSDDKGKQKQIPATVTKISYPVNRKGQVLLEAKSEYSPHAQHCSASVSTCEK
jgi:hypothetical protein